MKKMSIIFLMALFSIICISTALSKESPQNTEATFFDNKDFQREKLNKLTILRGASSFTFSADILGTGTEQTIKVFKDEYGDYTIFVSQQDEILTSLSFIGPKNNYMVYKSNKIISSNEAWYLVYLYDHNTPSLVYCFIDGSEAYLNDFKVIGITRNKEIGILFDGKPYKIPEKIGGHTQLSIEGTQLLLTGQKSHFAIKFNNAKSLNQ